jgi:serine/threonine protein kinase
MFIVTDYAPDGDLEKYMEILFKNETLPKSYIKIFTMIICSIKYLHLNRIVHRDIKPANFLIKKLQNNKILLKCNDFDLAKFIDDEADSAI